MTSSLTGSGLKSGYLYVLLLVAAFSGGTYFIFFKQPNVIDNLNRQAFRLNFSAFKSGIRTAHLKFVASQPAYAYLDIWQTGSVGLDYNPQGFPIGTSLLTEGLALPISSENCRQIWQFVLNPMQQEMNLSPSGSAYWTQLTDSKQCEYRASDFEFMWINYAPQTGQVSLVQEDE